MTDLTIDVSALSVRIDTLCPLSFRALSWGIIWVDVGDNPSSVSLQGAGKRCLQSYDSQYQPRTGDVQQNDTPIVRTLIQFKNTLSCGNEESVMRLLD